jgi:hypothetical protein
MPRNYKEMPPLWHLESQYKLSVRYPSGLEWLVDKAGYNQGDQAGRIHKKTGHYIVCIDGQEYQAHRIVYYLRTGLCPDEHAVVHTAANEDKDNRLGLKSCLLKSKNTTIVELEPMIDPKLIGASPEPPTPGLFTYVKNIDSLSEEEELKTLGYYKGYPCAHGHTIRNIQEHWCYHCAIKIQSNVCGFDINFLNERYKYKYFRLWEKVKIGHPDECWQINAPGKVSPRRVCFPSYRAFYSDQTSENVNFHKLLYQCAWGDVGFLSVTRLCGNPWCGNPLHMFSRWNRGLPPKRLEPFDTHFDAQKLMAASSAIRLNKTQALIERDYKPSIAHPCEVNDVPDYHEDA